MSSVYFYHLINPINNNIKTQ
ncbi:protein of unknown function [Xenorhabdus doucetiae]|uniref:Uncharacterized protein n=1 Tax=Xenorhabdus doucetiae TaxID=351671 RepID=A0A068QNW7_9GAMM|nr:protein of unknown function [Xenorhabdus doucetiae]